MSLKGKVALVAGATRGAGRGIAVELGAAGATVYVTGRTTRDQPSEYARPETIEETAELVIGIRRHAASPFGSIISSLTRSRTLVERIRAEQGRLDVLVNDLWGGENLKEWNKPVWEHDLENGLRMLSLGVHTHLITAHYALPLLIERPGGLLVEVTDGTADVQRGPLPDQPVLRSRQGGGDAHGLGACQGPRAAWRDFGLDHARVAALGDDAGGVRRDRGELA